MLNAAMSQHIEMQKGDRARTESKGRKMQWV